MIYLIAIGGIIGIYFLLWLKNTKKKISSKKTEEFKRNWGKPIPAERNLQLISTYSESVTHSNYLNASVVYDLDIEGIFNYVDRCSSKPGQQYLFHRLNNTDLSLTDLSKMETKIAKVVANADERLEIQAHLSRLDHVNAYYIPELFNKKHQSVFHPLIQIYIQFAWVLVIVFIYLLIMTHAQFFLLGLIAMIVANLFIHLSNKHRILKYTRSIPQFLLLNKIGQWLLTKGIIEAEENTIKSFHHTKQLSRTLAPLNFQNTIARDPTDIAYLLTEWLNIGLLLEPLAFLKSLKKVDKYASDIKILFQQVAEVDVAISIQSLRDGLPFYSIPAFDSESMVFEADELYHPLVENCVPNSISVIRGKGVLITGSNMSGKTTYIRAIACNALLAQTLNTSCTKKYAAPVLQILTSITVNDNLQEQKSYFQAEALSILDIIVNSGDSSISSLIIIDEIFKGTNTIERIAAAKAVLSHFAIHKNFVFVSTHDLELAEMLADEYMVFSFAEFIDDHVLTFDYQLRPGLLKKQNGIAVLDFLHYPKSIITEAQKVKRTLTTRYNL